MVFRSDFRRSTSDFRSIIRAIIAHTTPLSDSASPFAIRMAVSIKPSCLAGFVVVERLVLEIAVVIFAVASV